MNFRKGYPLSFELQKKGAINITATQIALYAYSVWGASISEIHKVVTSECEEEIEAIRKYANFGKKKQAEKDAIVKEILNRMRK